VDQGEKPLRSIFALRSYALRFTLGVQAAFPLSEDSEEALTRMWIMPGGLPRVEILGIGPELLKGMAHPPGIKNLGINAVVNPQPVLVPHHQPGQAKLGLFVAVIRGNTSLLQNPAIQ